jgi:hypothetical protein
MDSTAGFYRTFFMLAQEDAGYGIGQAPSGYVKIEVREKRGKLHAMVQNLRTDEGRLRCMLYLSKHDGGVFVPVCAGEIPFKGHTGILKWEFDPADVGMTGHPIEDFKIAAVLLQGKNGRQEREIICPLAAFKSTKEDWREKMKAVLYHEPSAARDDAEVIEKPVDAARLAGSIESKYKPPEDTPEFNIPQSCNEYTPDRKEEIESVINEEFAPADKFPAHGADEGTEEKGREEPVKEAHEAHEEEEGMERPASAPGGCIFADNSLCIDQAGDSQTDPCLTCEMNRKYDGTVLDGNPHSDMEGLKSNFDRYFVRHDPFNSRRRDYKWWKLDNPVLLNNILYRCNIRTPLLFNPLVMMAHYKYRHLIIGIYTDRIRRREYIVCGVPGVYDADERPFGSMCRWIQLEGGRPRYGAFGYWLVYMDPGSGKFLSLS